MEGQQIVNIWQDQVGAEYNFAGAGLKKTVLFRPLVHGFLIVFLFVCLIKTKVISDCKSRARTLLCAFCFVLYQKEALDGLCEDAHYARAPRENRSQRQ